LRVCGRENPRKDALAGIIIYHGKYMNSGGSGMGKSINSYVQIPKAILKNFSFRENGINESNQVIKCDMQKNNNS